MEQTNEFLDKKNIFAIVGISADPDKWGFKFNSLRDINFINSSII